MRYKLQALLSVALLAWAVGQETPSFAVSNVATTKHNLAVSGPGTIKSTSETDVCIFCHTPHSASSLAPLWNRNNPTQPYTPYSSSTAKGSMGQPNGSSLLCLSCHDGTIALGELLSRPGAPVAVTGTTANRMPAGTGLLGTDLSDDHPVSIAYNTALINLRGGTVSGELADPTTLPSTVKLDKTGQMQCSTCHDAHDNTFGKFLVMANTASALCTTCHTKSNWLASAHQTSTRTWNGVLPNPWPTTSTTATTVAANACENCHQPHSAPGRKSLVHTATEEGTCLNCHNGNAATRNISAEFAKTGSVHAMTAYTGIHDPVEANVVTSKHVECSDCHNPHAAKATGTATVPGPLTGVKGVNISGVAVGTIANEAELCFRCHGDSAATAITAPRINRVNNERNMRLKFATTNASYHPVAGIGKGTSVPSLITPWTTSSTMTCGDCHNNNTGPGAGGTGPKGPHGSTYDSLLERQYLTADNTTSNTTNYALCYKCHSSTSITGNGAGSFQYHGVHLGNGINAPCSACHDPHGSTNTGLINFDTSIVSQLNTTTPINFTRTTGGGTCNLSCHNKAHTNWSYNR